MDGSWQQLVGYGARRFGVPKLGRKALADLFGGEQARPANGGQRLEASHELLDGLGGGLLIEEAQTLTRWLEPLQDLLCPCCVRSNPTNGA